MSQKALDAIRKQNPDSKLPKQAKDLTDDQINTLFYQEYFQKAKIKELQEVPGLKKAAPKLAEHVFDAGIMSGPADAGAWLQEAIDKAIGTDLKTTKDGKKTYDGIIGSETRAALEKAIQLGKAKQISKLFADKRQEYVRGLPDYSSKKESWERRIQELRDDR
jgi:lysozyme family protein